MRQLVGLPCTRCEKTIPSIIAGEFCPECGCPVHLKCEQPDPTGRDGCRVCGSSLEAAKANQQQEKTEATVLERDVRVNRGFYYVNIGIAIMFIAAPISFLCGGALVSGAVFLIGLGQILLGVTVMMRKGPPQY